MKRLIYEIRWWYWFLWKSRWPMKTLYFGPYRLDKDSRRIIIERSDAAWEACEPSYQGKFRWKKKAVE